VIVDFHTHIVPPRVKENRLQYAQADRGFAAIYSDPRARLATADDLIRIMDRDSVDVAVALNYGWANHSLCVEVNDYILDSVTRFPNRLAGFCNVSLANTDTALREIERCTNAGINGVGEIRPDTQLGVGGIDGFKPVTDFMIAHKLMLLTHASEPVGHQYPGKGNATPGMIMKLVTAYPGLTVICAHFGGGLPFYALMPEVADAFRNVYFDTAAAPYLYRPDVYRHVIDLVGQDNVLFGSDYPLITPRRYVKDIESIDLPAIAKEKLLGENARRLLDLPQRGEP
jgi:predicted TIM-barrel fold metal-dependent hydrolase